MDDNAMKKTFALLFTFFMSPMTMASEPYSVYLIRHAEKELIDPTDKNPNLTPCGMQRAERLTTIMKNINLDVIYSSDYTRTRETARPIAKDKQLTEKIYAPDKLGQLAEIILANKKDALVVGHSDTTGVLAGMLAGIEVGEIDETKYDRLYQVVLYQRSAKLSLLHQAFKCEKGPI